MIWPRFCRHVELGFRNGFQQPVQDLDLASQVPVHLWEKLDEIQGLKGLTEEQRQTAAGFGAARRDKESRHINQIYESPLPVTVRNMTS